jgi:biotin operon repressor
MAKKLAKTGNRKHVSFEEFVKAYQTSESVAEVKDKLKISGPTIANKAKLLKKAGVNLKSLRRGRTVQKPDVTALNQLIKELKSGKSSS